MYFLVKFAHDLLLLAVAAATQAVPGIKKQQQDTIYSLFDQHVDAGLTWVRKSGTEYIPSVDNNLASSLALLLQVGQSKLCTAVDCTACSADLSQYNTHISLNRITPVNQHPVRAQHHTSVHHDLGPADTAAGACPWYQMAAVIHGSQQGLESVRA